MKDIETPQDTGTVPTAASEPRWLVKEMKDAEQNARAAADKLKAAGEVMAKKHGC